MSPILLVALAGCWFPLMPGDPYADWAFVREDPGANPVVRLFILDDEMHQFLIDRNDDGVWDYYLTWLGDHGDCRVDEDFDGVYDVLLRLDRRGQVTEARRAPELPGVRAGGVAYGQFPRPTWEVQRNQQRAFGLLVPGEGRK